MNVTSPGYIVLVSNVSLACGAEVVCGNGGGRHSLELGVRRLRTLQRTLTVSGSCAGAGLRIILHEMPRIQFT